MAADKFEAYYWDIYAIIFESGDTLALGDPAFSLSDVDTASKEQAIHAVLPFRDPSTSLRTPGCTLKSYWLKMARRLRSGMHISTTMLEANVSCSMITAAIIRKSRPIHITCAKDQFPPLARKTVHGQLISSL